MAKVPINQIGIHVYLMSVHRTVSQCFGVAFKCAVVVQIRVAIRDVGIRMMTDDVLVVPDKW